MPSLPTQLPDALLSRRHWLALAGTATLAACGGGGSSTAGDGPTVHPLGVATGGTGRVLSFVSAPVTAIEPLVVGGIGMDTRDASITDGDGRPMREGDLAAGMTAQVLAGAIASGSTRALSIKVDTQVAGPALWLDGRTLQVLGQRVSLASGALRGAGAEGQPADVQVWGQLDLLAGRIVARRVDLRPAGTPAMLRGVLGSLDRSTGSLQVGPLFARTGDAALIPSGLAEGAVVRLVLGEALPDGSWQLLAVRDDALRPPDGLRVELEGCVTQFSSTRRFALDGVPVDASHAKVEGLAQLLLGAQAEVHGSMRDGVLIATEVAAEAPEPLELAGRITALDAGSQTLLLNGWQVRWDAATRFSGGVSASLRVGRQVAVKARWRPGDAALVATKISLD